MKDNITSNSTMADFKNLIDNKCKIKCAGWTSKSLLNHYLTLKLRPICKVDVGRIPFN